MKTATHIMARGLVMILLAVFTTATSNAQFMGSGTAEDPFLINNAKDWEAFTYNINIIGVGTASYYKLTDDITIGSENNPISTIVGNDDKKFRGTFDGDFHTIHLFMKRSEKYAAPFGVTNGATIKNLKVDGTIITTNKFAGGIVAFSKNENNSSTNIINCISSINIICDGIITVNQNKPYDCTHGGFVGQNDKGVLNFENCIFDGSITDSKYVKTANKCTGFVGWVNNTVNYTRCTMAGYIDVKPNSDTLVNSMANFHRLSNSAKANFDEETYYITDYTYQDIPRQGMQALFYAPVNTISKVYSVDRVNYFVPGAEINNNNVIYYGWMLAEGIDYVINKVSTSDENTLVVSGINNYFGSCVTDVDPTCQISVTTWDGTENTGWQAISSPVDSQRFANVNHLTTVSNHNIYRYDEVRRQWVEYRDQDNGFDHFTNGCGYLYRSDNMSESLGFNGTLITGDVEYNLSYTEKSDNQVGFNLIGNPYNHVIYKGVAIPNDNIKEGYCVMTTNGTWEFKDDDVAIPVGAAVMVQAITADNITIKDTDDAPFAKSENDNIWFTVNDSQYEDVACINFKEGRGYNKIAHYNEEAPMLYINYKDKSFASADISEDLDVINLAFEAKKTGEYTLSFNIDGQFDYLHLIDRMTGADVNMLIEDEYSFIGSSSDITERFIVKLSYDAVTETIPEKETFAWQNGGEIIVNGQGILEIYDLTGKMVDRTAINGMGMVSGIEKGIYVMRLIDNTIKSQKIVIN